MNKEFLSDDEAGIESWNQLKTEIVEGVENLAVTAMYGM